MLFHRFYLTVSFCVPLAVVKAWKVLENEEGHKKCLEIVEEAKAMTEQNVSAVH